MPFIHRLQNPVRKSDSSLRTGRSEETPGGDDLWLSGGRSSPARSQVAGASSRVHERDHDVAGALGGGQALVEVRQPAGVHQHPARPRLQNLTVVAQEPAAAALPHHTTPSVAGHGVAAVAGHGVAARHTTVTARSNHTTRHRQ